MALNLGLGEPAPDFRLESVMPGGAAGPIALDDYQGKWLALLFYPRDFSFVCPTELSAFSGRAPDFADRQCDILAVSLDDLETHRRWLETPADAGGVGGLRFPLGSDPDGSASRAYGVWDHSRAIAHRGLFLIDPQGLIQYAVVHALSVGRPVRRSAPRA